MKYTRYCFLFLVIIINSCKDDDNVNGSANESTNGQVVGVLRGAIALYDSNDMAVTDKSGVHVTLDGTSFSAYTDSLGLWTINNLPTRVYPVTFSKQGYSSVPGQMTFVAGDTLWYYSPLYPAALVQPPTYTVTLDAMIVENSSPTTFLVYGHMSKNAPINVTLKVAFITSHSPNPDFDNTAISVNDEGNNIGTNRYSKQNPDSIVQIGKGFDYYSTLLTGFSKGDTIYTRAYPLLGNHYQYEYNFNTKRTIYVGHGVGSNVLSAVIP
jgi:hypothetical protein